MADHGQPQTAAADMAFPEMVSSLTTEWVQCWWESKTTTPSLGPTYTIREQLAHEDHLEHFWDLVSAELEHVPQTAAERSGTQQRILSAFATLARAGLGWREDQIEFLLGSGFVAVANEFIRAARRFDPAIPGSDIFQAGRNAWTMNGLQLLLGLPVQLTPAILAYSLLYPYTDNYLDDPSLAEDDKVEFNRRFARRLAGEAVEPQQDLESPVYRLVEMIEGQYSRASVDPQYSLASHELCSRACAASTGRRKRACACSATRHRPMKWMSWASAWKRAAHRC